MTSQARTHVVSNQSKSLNAQELARLLLVVRVWRPWIRRVAQQSMPRRAQLIELMKLSSTCTLINFALMLLPGRLPIVQVLIQVELFRGTMAFSRAQMGPTMRCLKHEWWNCPVRNMTGFGSRKHRLREELFGTGLFEFRLMFDTPVASNLLRALSRMGMISYN